MIDYWVTLWYAGAVVMQLGGENVSYDECKFMKTLMEKDIQESYANPEKLDELTKGMFPTNQFEVTCETKRLQIDEKYIEKGN